MILCLPPMVFHPLVTRDSPSLRPRIRLEKRDDGSRRDRDDEKLGSEKAEAALPLDAGIDGHLW